MQDFKNYREDQFKLSEQLDMMCESKEFKISTHSAGSWVVSEGDVTFESIKKLLENKSSQIKESHVDGDLPLFSEYVAEKFVSLPLDYLTEEENLEVDRWVKICEEEHNGDLLDESFLGKLVGGAAGFIIGPSIGKIIARALGVNRGILYDMFTSRLVSAALGAAIAKKFGGEYKG